MNLTKFTENVNIISQLDDTPSQTGNELKAKFDEASGLIKSYINNTLTTETEQLVATEKSALQQSISNLNTETNQKLGQITEDVEEKTAYSTEEQIVGTLIINNTEKNIYRKVVNIGSLPNNTTQNVAHNINNFERLISINASWYDSGDAKWLTSPRIDNNTTKIVFRATTSSINIEAVGTNWSTRTNNCIAIIEYTKTID